MGRKKKLNPTNRFSICLPKRGVDILIALNVLNKRLGAKENLSNFIYSLLVKHYGSLDLTNKCILNEIIAKNEFDKMQNDVDIANRELTKTANYLAEVRAENEKKGVKSIYITWR